MREKSIGLFIISIEKDYNLDKMNKCSIYIERALFNFMNHCDNSGVLIGTKPVSLCILLSIIINLVMINSKVFIFLFYFSVKSM